MLNFRKRFCQVLSTIAVAIAAGYANADITVARIFSDHMVLQQQAKVRIWGTTKPQRKLIIAFNDQETAVEADAQGKWSGVLETPVAGGPYTIEVRAETGEPRVQFSNVMVGEVWICSGQSNMEWPIEKAEAPEREIAGSKDFPNIRFLDIQHSALLDPNGDLTKANGWDVCNPETARTFSATAYFFGRRLNQELNIPIGLVKTTWGGTPCEAWISSEALAGEPGLKPLLDHWETLEVAAAPHRPANLYNGMVAPLRGITFRGVIWYQGESNVKRAEQYRTLFPLLISDWRKQLAGGREFPFYFVQLAPFRYSNNAVEALAELWDTQLETYRTTPNLGIVVTTDVTELNDIHPRNKQAVGARLAGWALSDCYRGLPTTSEPVNVPSGPLYRNKEISGHEIRINFDFVAEGLVAKDDEPLNWFTVCGADQKFVAASARIEGDQVVVWSDEITDPREVRFAWSDTATPNLFNSFGLPASPFRTDRYPLSSEGNHF